LYPQGFRFAPGGTWMPSGISRQEALADSFGKRAGLDIAVIAATRERLPAPLEIALYRIAQEALINANRHARARRITVQIRVEANMVHCCVSDDGVGFGCETAPVGLGLLGIRERLAQLGGRLTITSRIGEGTRIAVDIPACGRPPVDRPPFAGRHFRGT
jgi:signal transduction histidine kinase